MSNQTLNWDQYFMSVALILAKKSPDPSSQVGCVIVDKDNKIVSTGYNDSIKGKDCGFGWEREAKNPLDTKYPYVIHSEMNALINAKCNLNGCKIYVTLFPCGECAKNLVQAGITEIIYLENKYPTQTLFKASDIIFKKFNIKCRQYKLTKTKIEINI
ncbi:MAG: dCMP deaminase family protein [Mycoplasmoidaceae bacterium]|nr:MAG: dCMP deaminase family protein [Mycoplasmoidaceae bacterium]